jgi:large subunit ribosomal protein L1
MARSNRYKALKEKIDPKKLYTLPEAIALAKETSGVKFNASIEAHFNLGIDIKKSDQQIRSTLLFPHSIGSTKKVIAFVSPDKEKEAKEAGADIIGNEEYINDLAKSGKIDFDIAVATPDMMPKIAKLAKTLGPIGLMPNPKTETVGPNVAKMVEEIKKGKISFKNDITGNVHQVFGKMDLDDAKLQENLTMLIEAVKKVKPSGVKGEYIKSLTVTTTMGPGIRVDAASV